MGIFDKLFGKNKSDIKKESTESELRLKYNVMKNIKLEKSEKYENAELFKLIENGIYLDLNEEEDIKYRMTISYELENDDSNNQYPLEDILDKYLMFVSDFLENENEYGSGRYKLELGGNLDKMEEAHVIFGKKIYHQDFLDDDGQVRVQLVIR